MLDALLIAVVAGMFVMLVTSRRRLRGPIPLAALPRLHDNNAPPAVAIEAPRPARTASRAGSGAVPTALRVARQRASVYGQAAAKTIRGFALHRQRAAGFVLVVAASAVVWFVWPTPYRALPLRASGARIGKSFDVVALRQQRITGRVDALVTGGGWVCVTGC